MDDHEVPPRPSIVGQIWLAGKGHPKSMSLARIWLDITAKWKDPCYAVTIVRPSIGHAREA